MKIILLGYMGSGKTAIGKELSHTKSLPFVDLDGYIEKKEKKEISEIFKDEGEIYFRLKENEYLKELLNKKEDFILALGGGTPCYANNIEIILSKINVTTLYLKSTIKNLVNRLKIEKQNRPLINNILEKDLSEYVAKHLFERNIFYQKANFTINVTNKEIKEIVNEIITTLNKQ